jgi:dihydrofolate synthase / folylpolyglutamate synthase
MTYAEAVEFLYELRVFGAKPGLENTLQLASLAGEPHRRLRFIHVAGTNGKGSTCAMLESIYRAAGLRVGLFTSPHLVSFAERLQINRQPAPEREIVRLLCSLQPLLKRFPADTHPTFFEVVTVMALRYFEEQRCDIVIWETGLGGRLDATNIVTPLVSVITNIALDHQQWLGDTHEQIAGEKAGIIKPGVPVVTAAETGRGLEKIATTAQQQDALLTVIDRNDANGSLIASSRLPLLGVHQRLNAALAVAAVRAASNHVPVGHESLVQGLANVHWAGRMQLVSREDGRQLLLDGAHNLHSAEALASAFRQQFAGVMLTIILGVLADKDWQRIAQTLAPLARRLYLVPVNSERSLAPTALEPVCRAVNADANITVCSSLAEALESTADAPFLLITGSLYLIGEAMERLRLLPVPCQSERGLNEYTVRS